MSVKKMLYILILPLSLALAFLIPKTYAYSNDGVGKISLINASTFATLNASATNYTIGTNYVPEFDKTYLYFIWDLTYTLKPSVKTPPQMVITTPYGWIYSMLEQLDGRPLPLPNNSPFGIYAYTGNVMLYPSGMSGGQMAIYTDFTNKTKEQFLATQSNDFYGMPLSFSPNGFYLYASYYIDGNYHNNIKATNRIKQWYDEQFLQNYVSFAFFETIPSYIENYDIFTYQISKYEYQKFYFGVQDYNRGYNDGKVVGSQDGYTKGFTDGEKSGYDKGYPVGFNDGTVGANTIPNLIMGALAGVGSLLSTELLPNISIGAVIAVPIIFGIIAFIVGKRGGKDE